MRKIPTVFARDATNRAHVIDEVTPDCQWVLDGEGVATRKFDGTCVLIRRDGVAVHAFARRVVKRGKQPPPNFVEVECDPFNGNAVGWEPAEQSAFAEQVHVALSHHEAILPGTYELVGPKVNRNPEGYARATLIRHGDVKLAMPEKLTFDTLRDALLAVPFEGVVWWHPDGRLAKLKRRDFE